MEPPLHHRHARRPLPRLAEQDLCPDDEGSDHAYDEHEPCAQPMRGGGGRPQHPEAAPRGVRATPHGAMTSILSAADYAPPQSAVRKEWQLQSQEHADKEAPPQNRTNGEAAGEGAAKKALRLRASRHFHRGAGGKSNTVSGNAREAGKGGPSPNHSERASLSRAKLNAATRPLPKAQGSPPRGKALPSPSSLDNFPRTRSGKGGPSRKDSPPEPQPQPQPQPQPEPQPQPQYEMASSKEDDPDLQVFSDIDAQSTATSGYHSGSDLENAARRLLRGRGKRRYPSPQTLRGEDAEWAKLRSGSAEGESAPSGPGDSANAKNGEGTNAVRPKATLPKGWRERIERKTGRRVPRMEASKENKTGTSEEASKELNAFNDASGSDRDFSSVPQSGMENRYDGNQHGADGQPLPFTRQQSGHSAASSEHDAYYHPEDLANDGAFPSYQRRLPQVLEGGEAHRPAGREFPPQPYPPSRGREREFPLPYAPGTRPYRPPYPQDLDYPAGESGSLEEDEGSPLRTTRYEYRGALGAVEESPGAEYYYSHEEWNPDDMAMGSTVGASWEESPGVRHLGGDGRGFSASTINYNGGGDGYMNGGPSVRPIPITESGFPISSLDGPAYSMPKASTKRVRFSASVDGGEGDGDQHSEGDDDDEYFHRFYSKAAEDSACWDEVPAPQHEHSDLCTHWEPIPASPNVKWTTSTAGRGRRSSSLPPPATTQEDIDVFKWNGSDTGMASIPRWKAQKLFEGRESPPKDAPQDASIQPIESRGVTRKSVESRGRSPARPVMYTFAGDDKLETKPKKSSQALHAFSDGDASDGYSSAEGWSPRKSKRGLRSFLSRSRSGSRTRTYKSEGERSDNDWDSADDRSNFSFSLSPMRRGRKTKKKSGYTSSKSPRRMKLFGEKHHPTSDAEDTAPRVYTEIYVTGEVGKRGTDSITTPITSNQTEDISSVQAIAGQIKQKKRSPKSKAKPALVAVSETKVQESMEAQPAPPTLGRIEEPAIVAKLNASMETQTDTNLNDSRETQETPLVSNAKVNGRAMQQRTNTNRPPLPPLHDVKIEASASDDSPHSGTTIRTEDDGSVSTLGSLVTRDNSEAKPKKTTGQSSDMSTVTELSEIERLRKENDRLREELENASNLSSRVSSMYAESLKRENVRLREELDHTPELSNRKAEDATHKSTLEMLLENDNKKRTKKKSRRRRPPRKRNDTLTSFDHLPPVAHMINGDFDDDSTTINSIQQRRRGRRDADCDTGTEFIKKCGSKVATTARSLAVEAIELNNERRATGSSCTVPVPACFTACARRNRNGSVTTEVTHKRSNSWRKVAHKVEPSESSTTESMTSVSRSEPRSPRGRSRTKRPVSMSSVPETPSTQ